MGIMLKQYLDRFAAMEKKANETLSAEPEALVGVNSLPGSEHDQSVPAEAKKPDAEVQQGQPAGATTAEGAVNGGDAKPLNEGKLEVDQPLDNPEQKPMITDDALTAKEASAHLASIVGDLLKDIGTATPSQKQAGCGGEGATHAATPAAPKKDDKKDDGKGEEKKASKPKIELDDDTLSKIAAATAVFMAGREAAGKAIKQASEKKAGADVVANARKLIKEACVKAAQDAGLDPAAAEAAADNAMAAAGVAPEEVAAADAGAAAAEAQGAADAEAAAQEAADEAQGAATAEAAIKDAAAHIRNETLKKVANHIVAKRNEKQAAAKPGARVIQKVASILQAKKEAYDAQAKKAEQTKQASAEERYIAGFKKKAEEMGVDPAALAKYICETHKAQAK